MFNRYPDRTDWLYKKGQYEAIVTKYYAEFLLYYFFGIIYFFGSIYFGMLASISVRTGYEPEELQDNLSEETFSTLLVFSKVLPLMERKAKLKLRKNSQSIS